MTTSAAHALEGSGTYHNTTVSPNRSFSGFWSPAIPTANRADGGRFAWPPLSGMDTGEKMRSKSELAVEAAFMTVQDAATYLGISVNTLYVWRHRRQGPPSFRMGPGGRVMYRRELLDAWLVEQEDADSRSNSALNPLNKGRQPRNSRDR
ncbi:helix-turn-helix domain-containing protein [Kitasatospora sp. NPDC001309]|uniref:helix-turn-helix domain-containing protein n=1 Tax=Kitasatospora sp. NPDC001309 TaxID=3364013 RepID=UPI00369992BA